MVERERRDAEFVRPIRFEQIDRFTCVAFVERYKSAQGRHIGYLNLRVFRIFLVELVRAAKRPRRRRFR